MLRHWASESCYSVFCNYKYASRTSSESWVNCHYKYASRQKSGSWVDRESEHSYMIYTFVEYGSRRDPLEKSFLLQRVSAVGTQLRCQRKNDVFSLDW